MEFEDVNERIERECRRVAAAFGIREWELRAPEVEDECPMWTGHTQDGVLVEWDFERGAELRIILVNESEAVYHLWLRENEMRWEYARYPGPRAHHPELVARGLHCLGIDGPHIVSQLNHPLSTHEKLELRLSLPQEFWPQTWLDEESQ